MLGYEIGMIVNGKRNFEVFIANINSQELVNMTRNAIFPN